MNSKLTHSLAWVRYPSYLRFFHAIFASFVMSLSLSACSDNISESSQPAINSQANVSLQTEAVSPIAVSQNALKAVNQAVPVSSKVNWVLEGTDLLKKAEVKHSSGHPDTDWSGQYSSEQGGSLLKLRIERQGQGQWSLSRDYSEPALKTQNACA